VDFIDQGKRGRGIGKEDRERMVAKVEVGNRCGGIKVDSRGPMIETDVSIPRYRMQRNRLDRGRDIKSTAFNSTEDGISS